MIRVNTHEAKSRLSELLALVESGREEVTICRNGKAVAKLVGVGAEVVDHFKINPKLKVIFHENPMAPLDEESWPEEFR